MKTQNSENRVRPAFAALLVCTVAVIMIPVWMLTRSTPVAKEPTPTVQTTATVAKVSVPAKKTPATVAAPAARVPSVAVQTPPVLVQHTAPIPRRSAASRHEKLLKVVGGTVPSSKTGSTLEDRWGIKVLGASLSMGNAILDLRYKIIDPKKVASLASGNTRSFIFDPATGETFFLPTPPKEGAFPPSGNRLSVGKTYFAAVANRKGVLQNGKKISLVIGDCVLTNVFID